MNLAIIKLLGIAIFLYLIWRNLKENYQEESLISYSWMALLSFFIGGRIVYGLLNFGVWNDNWYDWFAVWNKPGMSFLGGFLVVFGVTYWYCKKEDWKIWSFAEDSLNIYLVLFGFLMIDEFIRSGLNLEAGVYIVLTIIAFLVSITVRSKYRSFGWYKSGKKGFVFLFVNAIVCFLLAGISFWFKESIIYACLYIISGLISLSGLFILGEVFEELMVNIKRKKNDKAKIS